MFSDDAYGKEVERIDRQIDQVKQLLAADIRNIVQDILKLWDVLKEDKIDWTSESSQEEKNEDVLSGHPDDEEFQEQFSEHLNNEWLNEMKRTTAIANDQLKNTNNLSKEEKDELSAIQQSFIDIFMANREIEQPAVSQQEYLFLLQLAYTKVLDECSREGHERLRILRKKTTTSNRDIQTRQTEQEQEVTHLMPQLPPQKPIPPAIPPSVSEHSKYTLTNEIDIAMHGKTFLLERLPDMQESLKKSIEQKLDQCALSYKRWLWNQFTNQRDATPALGSTPKEFVTRWVETQRLLHLDKAVLDDHGINPDNVILWKEKSYDSNNPLFLRTENAAYVIRRTVCTIGKRVKEKTQCLMIPIAALKECNVDVNMLKENQPLPKFSMHSKRTKTR